MEVCFEEGVLVGRYKCDLCGKAEHEYTGARAEYDSVVEEITEYELSRLCGGCLTEFKVFMSNMSGSFINCQSGISNVIELTVEQQHVLVKALGIVSLTNRLAGREYSEYIGLMAEVIKLSSKS